MTTRGVSLLLGLWWTALGLLLLGILSLSGCTSDDFANGCGGVFLLVFAVVFAAWALREIFRDRGPR